VCDGDVGEVNIPEIRHSELRVEVIDDALKKSWRRGGKDNIVDI
jgi:hypothetical protein